MSHRAADGSEGRRVDAVPVAEQDGSDHDPAGVQDRCEGIEQEPLVGDEHLADRDRGGEQDGRHAHQPEEIDVQGTGRRVEPLCHELHRRGRHEEQSEDDHRHHQDSDGQHGPGEIVGLGLVALAEPVEDRHERRGQRPGDEDVERDLGDLEGRVVGVELGPGAKG